MERKKILDNVSGSGASPSYFIHSDVNSEVQLFLTFTAGTITVMGSGDDVNFAPIKDGVFAASEVVPIDLANGSYLRVDYSGATGLTAIVVPKIDSNA